MIFFPGKKNLSPDPRPEVQAQVKNPNNTRMIQILITAPQKMRLKSNLRKRKKAKKVTRRRNPSEKFTSRKTSTIGTIVIVIAEIGAIVIGISIKDQQNPNREMIPFLVSLIFLLQDFAKNVM